MIRGIILVCVVLIVIATIGVIFWALASHTSSSGFKPNTAHRGFNLKKHIMLKTNYPSNNHVRTMWELESFSVPWHGGKTAHDKKRSDHIINDRRLTDMHIPINMQNRTKKDMLTGNTEYGNSLMNVPVQAKTNPTNTIADSLSSNMLDKTEWFGNMRQSTDYNDEVKPSMDQLYGLDYGTAFGIITT